MSYARTENDPYLHKFFDELSREVRRQLAKKERDVVGFFDQRNLERGDDWEEKIFDAINQSSALVALYSPSFFQSENCRREVNAFLARQNARDENAAGPAVILPVEWMPIESRLVPEFLRKFQFREGNPQSPINRFGVHLVRKLRKSGYDELLLGLARQIAECSKAAVQLPAAKKDQPAPKPVAAPEPPQTLGPSHVRFVYVAGSDSEPTVRPRSAFYGAAPNRWRPFQPEEPQSVGPLSQAIAAEQDLTSDELAFDEQVLEALREAEQRRNVVVLIVDGWSVSVKTFAELLTEFDERNYANCAVIAPWDDSDPLTKQHFDELKTNVRGVLQRWSASGPLRFTDAPTTMPQFRTTLASVLTSLRAQIFNSFAGRNTPFYPRPILTNTVDRAT